MVLIVQAKFWKHQHRFYQSRFGPWSKYCFVGVVCVDHSAYKTNCWPSPDQNIRSGNDSTPKDLVSSLQLLYFEFHRQCHHSRLSTCQLKSDHSKYLHSPSINPHQSTNTSTLQFTSLNFTHHAVTMAVPRDSTCDHSFVMIKSDTALLLWHCNYCHAGAFWYIFECKHCKIKACRVCTQKA